MITSETIRAHVVFRKQVSDGAYGSEVAEVMLEVPVDETYDVFEASVASTLQTARRLVHEELARSPSANVRRALESLPTPRLEDIDDPESLPF